MANSSQFTVTATTHTMRNNHRYKGYVIAPYNNCWRVIENRQHNAPLTFKTLREARAYVNFIWDFTLWDLANTARSINHKKTA